MSKLANNVETTWTYVFIYDEYASTMESKTLQTRLIFLNRLTSSIDSKIILKFPHKLYLTSNAMPITDTGKFLGLSFDVDGSRAGRLERKSEAGEI